MFPLNNSVIKNLRISSVHSLLEKDDEISTKLQDD